MSEEHVAPPSSENREIPADQESLLENFQWQVGEESITSEVIENAS